MIAKNYNISEISALVPLIFNVISEYMEGKSIRKIASKYGHSTNDIAKILKDNNIKIRFKNRKSDVDEENVTTLFNYKDLEEKEVDYD